MSLFSVSSKSKRNFRRRVVHSPSDSDAEEQADQPDQKNGSADCSKLPVGGNKTQQIQVERKVCTTEYRCDYYRQLPC